MFGRSHWRSSDNNTVKSSSTLCIFADLLQVFVLPGVFLSLSGSKSPKHIWILLSILDGYRHHQYHHHHHLLLHLLLLLLLLLLIIIIIIIIIIIPLEFFLSVSADGFLLEFEWQQVSSSLLKSPSDLFCGPPGQQSRQFFKFSFFVVVVNSYKCGLLAGIRWSVCKLKSQRSLCVSFSRTGAGFCIIIIIMIIIIYSFRVFHISISWWFFTGVWVTASLRKSPAGLCIYYLLVWSNSNFLRISQWITLPTQACLALYSFCANLLHSLIMWLIVSSLSLHSLHLLFCCVFFYLDRSRFSGVKCYYYYYYYYYFTSWEFFISALADGLLLKFEWQLVSSSSQDSSKYSGRSQ